MMLGDNIFESNLQDVLNRQSEQRADAAFFVEQVLWKEADRYGVCDTNQYGEIVEVVEKPDDPPSNRDEYEISDAVDLLVHSGRTIDAIRMDGWRIDVGYPEDRDAAERELTEGTDTQPATAETG
jgi:dTDP-glucose pyrophosphorylase